MFSSFFKDKKWSLWAWAGGVLILAVTWFKVQQSVKINEWYGGFYDYVQKILTKPGTSNLGEFFGFMTQFAQIAMITITVAVFLEFFVKHWVFRWRTAMTDFYTLHWDKLRHVEGASQRVQEDTARFARIVESLGVSFMRAIMTLIAFLPILWTLSGKITELPWLGKVDQGLVWVAILSAALGTGLLALVGMKLPGLEFNNQKVEAAYRKELVLGEDDANKATPPTLASLWQGIRHNYFKLYVNYLYFDVAKWAYLQGSVLIPLIALAPTLIAGVITFGVFQQILNVFDKVESSFQYLVNSWSTIVELISVFKRLRAFEQAIDDTPPPAGGVAGADGATQENVVLRATIQ